MGNKQIVYHGSVWQRPLILQEPHIENEMVFKNLSMDRNCLKAFFVSNNESVCNFFSEEKKGFDDEIFMQSMLEIEMVTDRVFEQNFVVGKLMSYGGNSYDYSCNNDRERLYDELRKDGYQAIVMKNDYKDVNGIAGDDIAILDASCIEAKRVKLKIGEFWTGYMCFEEAKEVFIYWSENSSEYSQQNNMDFNEDDGMFNYAF